MYTIRNKEVENPPQYGQSLTPSMVELNSSESQFDSFIDQSDLNLPITFIKGVKSYTQHLIAKFVYYHRLNSSFKAFTTNLFNVNTLKTIQDSLESPKWKEAVREEMRVLHNDQAMGSCRTTPWQESGRL